jgi:solute carrier family 6 GABA transporter-like protein 1
MIQVFFSTGVGFGYYTTYASYNRKFANAVQDAIIIVSANVTFEIFMAFGVFGIVGFLGLHPDTTIMGGSYDIGFVTFPSALEALPGSSFWSAIWFVTLLVLGVSSAFAMLDAVITLLLDSNPKFKRIWVVTGLVITCYLVSLPFCTEFGYHLLNAVDAWVNNLALVFVVWAEAVAATSVYRWKDVASEVGKPAYMVYNIGYFSGMTLGVVLGHAVSPEAGAGLGFGLFISGTVAALFLAKTPSYVAPRFFGRNVWLNKAWHLAFYQVLSPLDHSFRNPNLLQGNQLRNDLNIIIGMGKNWNIPVMWSPLLRYISAPILVIIFSFSYPDFYQSRMDPLHILGFTISHAALIMVGLGYIVPQWFDPIVPQHRRLEGDVPTATGINNSVVEAQQDDVVESGMSRSDGFESDKIREREEGKKSGVLSGDGNEFEGQGSGVPTQASLGGQEEKTMR